MNIEVTPVGAYGLGDLRFYKIAIWGGKDDHICFQATDQYRDVGEIERSVLRIDEVQHQCNLFTDLVDRIASQPATDIAQLNDIRTQGERLFDKIFPERIKSLLRDLSPSELLEFQISDFDMPVELFVLNDNDDYLSRKLRVTRLSTGDLRSVKANRAKQIDATSWLMSLTGYKLDAVQTEIDEFLSEHKFGAAESGLDVAAIGMKWRSVRCLWMTSHGIVDQHGPGLMLHKNPLRPNSLEKMPPVARQAFIFANACHGGKTTRWLQGTADFGRAFYTKGAGTFVSASTLVPAKFALRFGRELILRARPGENALSAVFSCREAVATIPGQSVTELELAEETLFRAGYRVTTNLVYRDLQLVPNLPLSDRPQPLEETHEGRSHKQIDV